MMDLCQVVFIHQLTAYLCCNEHILKAHGLSLSSLQNGLGLSFPFLFSLLLILIVCNSDLTVSMQSEANKENSREVKHAINVQANCQAFASENDLLESNEVDMGDLWTTKLGAVIDAEKDGKIKAFL